MQTIYISVYIQHDQDQVEMREVVNSRSVEMVRAAMREGEVNFNLANTLTFLVSCTGDAR